MRNQGTEGGMRKEEERGGSLAHSLSFSPFKYLGVSYSLAETSQMYMGC